MIMTYSQQKERARQRAIDWQCDIADDDLSYEDLIVVSELFRDLGKRFGLLKEFKRNGIPC